MANGFDISAALKFIEKNRDPIENAVLKGFIGKDVVTMGLPNVLLTGKDRNPHVCVYTGTLEEIYPTFHPNVVVSLRLKDRAFERYRKGVLGWKQVEKAGEDGTPYYISSVRSVFCDGEYYSVHIGHPNCDECEHCAMMDAHDWIKIYKEGKSEYYTANRMPLRFEPVIRKALKNYRKELKDFFGKEPVEKLLKEMSER